ncbi:Protein SUPPRESSOR OF NIM1 1 [Cardamine amara subsp. amara]|uniref:Protein SUPPRESSOR OF NIM1 1 n=1 Tax=Cardamine amara subsp. amara TaxID=228776 RepID=A0ABD0ZBH2_CARAN
MAPQLPCELEEDILSRLPPQSLIRFRSVCKKWNSLFTDKSFINNHMSRSRPQFILVAADSKIYSIDITHQNSIDPTIELRELPSSNFPLDKSFNEKTISACDELLFFNFSYWGYDIALWNPWLRQVKCIENKGKFLHVFGLGYDNSRREKVYKILCLIIRQRRIVIYECASYALKFIDTPVHDCHLTLFQSTVSLNGNLYWVTETGEFIQSFDFSTENFKHFCLLPCHKKHDRDKLILAVYKGDRFSLLKQSYETKKIEIWVTKKNTIDREEEEVVWINFMTLPTTNLPMLGSISYFIYDKTLFMCCVDDETRVYCIYIVREDLCKKIQIGSGIVRCCHCVYTPSLISVLGETE